MFIWTDEWLLLGFGESGICKISFHFFFLPLSFASCFFDSFVFGSILL